MFRGYMPAITLLVFAIGGGIGLAWSRGLIPIALTPANSGSLSPEVAVREPLPPPPDDSEHSSTARIGGLRATLPESEVVRMQTEPESDPVEQKQNAATANSADRNAADFDLRESVRNAARERDDLESSEETIASRRVKMRSRNAVRIDENAGIEEVTPNEKRLRVTAISHQNSNSTPEEKGVEKREEKRIAAREEKAAAISVDEQIQSAEDKLANGQTLVAHRELSKLYWNNKEARPKIQELVDSMADAIFFQPKKHYVEPYEIQDGDRLEAIAKKYQLSWEYIAKLNHTNPRRIQAGQKIKVMKGPFGAVVDLRDLTLTVHLQGYYVKRYQVGVGKDGSSPEGKFAVLNKVENPQYTDSRTGKVIAGDDPANPLGERWIDLGNSYGIHGTIDPDSIGKAESRGCIRMREADIIEVYDFLVKGSEVVLRR